MCRIAGMVSNKFPATSMKTMVEGMCHVQKHGGPDDQGVYVSDDGCLVFGNRRLALLDLSPSGHQPMHYEGRYTITYNGELYNYPELKSELISLGYSFSGQSDTEVILASFSEWNTGAFEKFAGMFAFALYDRVENTVFLVRDPAGIKPLYFSNHHESLVFASETRAFKKTDFDWTEDSNWPVYLMAYGHIPEPFTTYNTVSSLRKGCFLKYDIPTRRSTISSFAHYSFCSVADSDSRISQINATLHAAVKRHLIADAPIGVFLSGGLDSGIIASVAAGISETPINTLSIFFEEEEFSEKRYQDMILQRMRCIPNQYMLSMQDFETSFPEIIVSMDMPSCDGINTWFISRLARQQGLKAVLSGIGADELFGGYPSFSRMRYSRILKSIPGTFLKIRKRSGLKQLNRLSYLGMDGIKGIYLFLRGHFNAFEIANYLDASEQEIWNILNDRPLLGDVGRLDKKDQASWMEFNLYLQNQLLRDADVMGMSQGVEIRVPFLDDDVVRLAMAIPPGMKYTGNVPKQLLVDSFKASLPEAVWNRPKMGFSFPFQQWLKGSPYVLDLVNEGGSALKDQYSRFEHGGLHWSQLMSVILIHSRSYA